MRVILTSDVPALGRAGEVKDVTDGYGKNYLLPRKLAVEATAGAIRKAKDAQASLEAKHAREHSDAVALAGRLSKVRLIFTLKAGEQGKTFGSVTTKEIAEELSKQAKVSIEKTQVHLLEPLRTLGDHTVEIRLMSDVRANVPVVIKAA